MKRARETDVDMPVDVAPGRALGAWMTPPPAARATLGRPHAGLHRTPARAALFQSAEAISPWKQPPLARAHASHKRCRDRSVPMGTRAVTRKPSVAGSVGGG